jgi:hypothetical protein
MEKTPRDVSDFARRTPAAVPKDENFVVKDYLAIPDRLKALGIDDVPRVAVLPRNFDVAVDKVALINESIAADIRIIGRGLGIDVYTFQGTGARRIKENDALSIGAIILVTLEAFNNLETLGEFFARIARLVRDVNAGGGEVEITQEVVATGKKDSKKFTYRGPASGLPSIVPMIQTTMGWSLHWQPTVNDRKALASDLTDEIEPD